MKPHYLFLILMVVSFSARAGEVVHENKVDYLGLATGEGIGRAVTAQSALKESIASSFGQIEKRAGTDFSLFLRHPKEGRHFERFLNVMRVKFYTAPRTCGALSEAVSLVVPAKAGEREVLYAYSFVSCADGPLVTPVRFLDKYVEKYGLYDEKDFDRNQHVYNKVKGRWQVRVQPVSLEDKTTALVITVVDETVFGEAYRFARFKLRQSEEDSKEKF